VHQLPITSSLCFASTWAFSPLLQSYFSSIVGGGTVATSPKRHERLMQELFSLAFRSQVRLKRADRDVSEEEVGRTG